MNYRFIISVAQRGCWGCWGCSPPWREVVYTSLFISIFDTIKYIFEIVIFFLTKNFRLCNTFLICMNSIINGLGIFGKSDIRVGKVLNFEESLVRLISNLFLDICLFNLIDVFFLKGNTLRLYFVTFFVTFNNVKTFHFF
jgi:hypothetical protein